MQSKNNSFEIADFIFIGNKLHLIVHFLAVEHDFEIYMYHRLIL